MLPVVYNASLVWQSYTRRFFDALWSHLALKLMFANKFTNRKAVAMWDLFEKVMCLCLLLHLDLLLFDLLFESLNRVIKLMSTNNFVNKKSSNEKTYLTIHIYCATFTMNLSTASLQLQRPIVWHVILIVPLLSEKKLYEAVYSL